MRLNAIHYDTCFPSYFGGHHAPYLQIPVYKGISLKEIKQSLLSALNEGAVGGALDWELQQSQRLYKAMKAAINRIAPNVNFNHLHDCKDYEHCCCCDGSVHAYFVFLDDYGRFFSIDFLGGE